MNAIGVMAFDKKLPRLIDVRRPDRRRKQETAEPAGESEQRLRHRTSAALAGNGMTRLSLLDR